MKLPEEHLVERRVTYTLECEGKFYIVHNVPARVNEETGEQFFSPTTVEQLQRVILHSQTPPGRSKRRSTSTLTNSRESG